MTSFAGFVSLQKKIPEAERKTVYHSINEAVRTDGENSLGNDWISCAGAENVSAQHTESLQADGGDYYAGIEQIFVWDPDVVICNEAETKSIFFRTANGPVCGR